MTLLKHQSKSNEEKVNNMPSKYEGLGRGGKGGGSGYTGGASGPTSSGGRSGSRTTRVTRTAKPTAGSKRLASARKADKAVTPTGKVKFKLKLGNTSRVKKTGTKTRRYETGDNAFMGNGISSIKKVNLKPGTKKIVDINGYEWYVLKGKPIVKRGKK